MPEEVIDEAAPVRAEVPAEVEAMAGAPAGMADEEAAEGTLGAPEPGEEEGAVGSAPGGGPAAPGGRGRRRRDGSGGGRSNALGTLIERRFADPTSPVRSYSELERRSGISREALSRYVTPRADRRRSPTIDTLAAIADAMHLSIEQVARAAVASARGMPLPPEAEQQARDEVVAPLVGALSTDLFSALVELLRQMQPRPSDEF